MRLFPIAISAALLLAVPFSAPLSAQPAAAPAPQTVDEALALAPAGTRFGLLVVDDQGREIIAIRADDRFIPASNTKLFTTATAFALLADKVAAAKLGTDAFGRYAPGAFIGLAERDDGPPHVILYGRGDAQMSSAADCKRDCLAELADFVARKTRRVGDIVGDDSWFPDQRWSPGMSWNNIGTDSGTAISALSLDNNEVPVVIAPGAEGQPPIVEIAPYYTVRNEAVTIAAGGTTRLGFDRAINGTDLRIYGEIAVGAPPFRDRLGIDDPAHYTAWQLRRMLEVRGVKVDGAVRAQHRLVSLIDDPKVREGRDVRVPMPRAAFMGGHTAPPLADTIRIVNKDSQNLYAELLLRRVGKLEGTGSLADGIVGLHSVMAAAGVARGWYDFSDGSGMSTYNRISPRAAVTLLRWAKAQPWGRDWDASLPVGGVDGTLARRFRGTALEGKIRAKTGTLNATNTLSGYLVAASGRELTFSILANDVPDDGRAVPAMDAALGLIAATN
ncbi:D-alanyl-D-alanine carboxypeptidase/D-alanyl-D-alanine-endopeptidase [Novosphingobium sp.]|uniref:D-alanyl-D-alanine carboxypeptidase/D-alanyl-D-alanine endopeptidase n=1 Tax=Novosphingobium sp. TaxID=1874826 RepID=UPI002734C545|nr:D-alanyl-D-alanine carboxypeptidase/D-alanyl-D-alanine-endopeptidase [Novosphingobium sp.]MDP3908185.1 D-alanyl-D-alanine carboxypeptidase/D-alanyl-D-alanine-endopeptidase [Novosphingobium sp.]